MDIKKFVIINALLVVIVAFVIMLASSGKAVAMSVSSSVLFAAFMVPFYIYVKRFTDNCQPEKRTTYVRLYWCVKFVIAAIIVAINASAAIPAIISFAVGYLAIMAYEWHVIDKIKEDETII